MRPAQRRGSGAGALFSRTLRLTNPIRLNEDDAPGV
jgi:hypothetical protein